MFCTKTTECASDLLRKLVGDFGPWNSTVIEVGRDTGRGRKRPDSEAKDGYLRDLKRLRDMMIHSKKLGYGRYPMDLAMANLRNKYLEAHDTLERELG